MSDSIRYEQNRAERIVTHGPGCETWGPAHYECAVQEVEKLQHSLADRNDDLEKNLATIVHLSGRLAASREREARMRALLQAADVLFAHHCQDCTAWNWLDNTRAELTEGAQG